MDTVLIELPGGGGIVRRDDGEIAFTRNVTPNWGQSLQPWDKYRPIRLGLTDDRTHAEESCPVCGAEDAHAETLPDSMFVQRPRIERSPRLTAGRA